MYERIPEPYELWDSYCDEQEKEAEKLPICEECGERIYDDYLIDLDGDCFHEECFMKRYRKANDAA